MWLCLRHVLFSYCNHCICHAQDGYNTDSVSGPYLVILYFSKKNVTNPFVFRKNLYLCIVKYIHEV